MKGSGTMFYLIIEVFIFCLIAYVILSPLWSTSLFSKVAGVVGGGFEFTEKDMQIKSDFYVTGTGLKAARLYLKNALDYSVYQAMYENGINGLLNESRPETKETLAAVTECQKTIRRIEEPGHEIAYGTTNYQTGLLQQILTTLGHSAGKADCSFGPGTKAALEKFQEAGRLPKTGAADSATLSALKSEFLKRWRNCGDFFYECYGSVHWSAVPTEQDLTGSLRSSITKTMDSYTKGSFIFIGRAYSIPTYEEKDVNIGKVPGGFSVSANSTGKIAYSETIEEVMGATRLDIRAGANITKEYASEYFDMHKKAAQVFNKYRSKSCADTKTEEWLESGYPVKAEVLEKIESPCQAVVRITVSPASLIAKPLPVKTLDGFSMEPLRISYLVSFE